MANVMQSGGQGSLNRRRQRAKEPRRADEPPLAPVTRDRHYRAVAGLAEPVSPTAVLTMAL